MTFQPLSGTPYGITPNMLASQRGGLACVAFTTSTFRAAGYLISNTNREASFCGITTSWASATAKVGYWNCTTQRHNICSTQGLVEGKETTIALSPHDCSSNNQQATTARHYPYSPVSSVIVNNRSRCRTIAAR